MRIFSIDSIECRFAAFLLHFCCVFAVFCCYVAVLLLYFCCILLFFCCIVAVFCSTLLILCFIFDVFLQHFAARGHFAARRGRSAAPPPSHRCRRCETPGCAGAAREDEGVPAPRRARSALRSAPPRRGDAARSPRRRGRDGRQVSHFLPIGKKSYE